MCYSLESVNDLRLCVTTEYDFKGARHDICPLPLEKRVTESSMWLQVCFF